MSGSAPTMKGEREHWQAEGTVSPEQDGQTVAAVVRALLEGIPWSQARALCKAGRVQRHGEALLDPALRVRAGETIAVVHAREAAGPSRGVEVALRYVDPDVVVVDKPAGMLTVPYEGGERDTLLHRAHAALRRHEGKRHLPPLRVVQRLDKQTSGVVVFARNRRAERGLGDQLRRHDVERLYLAIAYGDVEAGTSETWLLPDRGDGRRGSWRGRGSPPSSARNAITHVAVRERFEADHLHWTDGDGEASGRRAADRSVRRLTLVACTLETGRQHQIRIHLGERGHPLVGEWVYDREWKGPRLHAFVEGRGRPMLHAARLGFRHPTDDRPRVFDSDLPSDFADLLRQLRSRNGG